MEQCLQVQIDRDVEAADIMSKPHATKEWAIDSTLAITITVDDISPTVQEEGTTHVESMVVVEALGAVVILNSDNTCLERHCTNRVAHECRPITLVAAVSGASVPDTISQPAALTGIPDMASSCTSWMKNAQLDLSDTRVYP
ncbi:hypothetical protein PF010_g7670 [Phytophthora fragariae]|uniref:Uncharacterized protein n=1 Tax=Phytophthora fragariae TaxID=53985 RepID=A0A6G0LGP6_9STRA|nr:hypothetical protein PF010_g7670 [Phytophthora fragariae]